MISANITIEACEGVLLPVVAVLGAPPSPLDRLSLVKVSFHPHDLGGIGEGLVSVTVTVWLI
jgi:hypothetical protein